MRETAYSISARHGAHDFRSELRAAIIEARSHSPRSREAFHRLIVRVPATDPLGWVGSLPQTEKFFWSARDKSDVVGGVGRAALVEAEGEMDFTALRRDISRYLSAAPSGSRFFGGIRFDAGGRADVSWSAFPTYRFVMPRFEARSVNGTSLIVCNIGPNDDYDRILEEIELLEPSEGVPDMTVPELLQRENSPEIADWVHSVDWSLSAFSSTTLAKVVLARKTCLHFDREIDPFGLLHRLRTITPSCYHFIYLSHGAAFLGASPEMLFRRDGASIRSEAVAGTAPRGMTEGADRELRQRLLLSEKDQREHEYVRQSIKEVLTPLTRVLHVETTASDMKLAQGRHLRSCVDGVLGESVDAVDLLRALHPTPAVGGHPHGEAMDVIRHLEPFDRGWYAGPVGWIAEGTAEFAVAIRSGLCRGKTLDLYSGAGIVCGSDPSLEWEEVEQKIGDFLRALELDNGR